ncbi:MAG TPA: conjugative transposon protein TraM [Panacibacter sp.]|nr:conjugative transposon protein TraM [Panacibacter sp.]
MENKKHSQKFLRQRKFLLILPLLTLPFITMIFWALGGGKGSSVVAQSTGIQNGLNLKLPDAKLKSDKGLDKLSFYRLAALDSLKLLQEKKSDPYWNELIGYKDNDTTNLPGSMKQNDFHLQKFNNRLSLSPNSDKNMDPNEAKVYSKLQQLTDQLNKSSSPSSAMNDYDLNSLYSLKQNYDASGDVDRLEGMMNVMKQGEGKDPEMEQLNTMLDKILAIQYPEKDTANLLAQERKKESNKVSRKTHKTNISLLGNKSITKTTNDTIAPNRDVMISLENEHNDFYSLEDEQGDVSNKENAIKAIIPETQTIVAGSTIKLLLTDDVLIKGTTIPRNTFIYGTVSLNNERLKISINSIRYLDNILPVALEVYDLDGLAGIYVPGSINRDVAKQSADQGINNIGFTTLDPSLAAQATSAGIQAAKSLISKKIKLVKVTVKAGYQVLLKDNNQK